MDEVMMAADVSSMGRSQVTMFASSNLIPNNLRLGLCLCPAPRPRDYMLFGGFPNLIDHIVSERKKDVQPTAGASFEKDGSLSSHISIDFVHLSDKPEQLVKKSSNGKLTNTSKKIIGLNITDHVPGKSSCSNSVSSSHIQDTSAQMPGIAVQREKYDDCGLSKKMKIDQSICLNSTSSDTMEAAILDLEELICRVKWLKRILEFGMPLSDVLRSSWKFMEHRGSSTPR